MNIAIQATLLTIGLLTLPAVHAHSPVAHQNHHAPSAAPAEQKDWGIAGDPKKVQRTIEIRMTDNMRFAPKEIQVKLEQQLIKASGDKELVKHIKERTKQAQTEAKAAVAAAKKDYEQARKAIPGFHSFSSLGVRTR